MTLLKSDKDIDSFWDDDEEFEEYYENLITVDTINTQKKSNMKNKFLDSKIKKIKFSKELRNKLTFIDIKPFMDIQSPEEAYLGAYSETEFFAFRYLKINKHYPSIVRIDSIKTNLFINKLFDTFDIPENSYYKSTTQNKNGVDLNLIMFALLDNITGKSMYFYLSDDEVIILYDHAVEKNEGSTFQILVGLLKGILEPKVIQNKIYVVYQTQSGFEKTGFNVKKVKVNLDDNYNEGFEDISKKLIEGLNSKDKTNLVLLSGDPGTGKTTFIRYLTSKIKKNIIFVSPGMVHSITDPTFIPFLIKNNNAVLIIEDAESAVESRDGGGRGDAVSNILNLTDGLLSDCLNISIIATFNTDTKNIDKALLRKGRLLMNYKFDKLSIDKSKNLLKKLGKNDKNVQSPMSLADIYFYDTDNNVTITKTKRVGFGN